MMIDDPYRILGLKPGASDDEIKRAYKEMAKKYHPDLNGNSPEAAEMMKKVNEAYDILINHKNTYSSSSSSSSGYQNGNSYGYSQRGPFEWYTGFGGQGFNFGFDENDFSRRYGMGPSLNRARALYNMREFGRCLQELSRIWIRQIRNTGDTVIISMTEAASIRVREASTALHQASLNAASQCSSSVSAAA